MGALGALQNMKCACYLLAICFNDGFELPEGSKLRVGAIHKDFAGIWLEFDLVILIH